MHFDLFVSARCEVSYTLIGSRARTRVGEPLVNVRRWSSTRRGAGLYLSESW